MIDKTKKYLFVCGFGQSRSLYFAERFMLKGMMALFCGFDDYADITFDAWNIKWADTIIVLDNAHEHDEESKEYLNFASSLNKEIILFHIQDEPELFNEKFNELIEMMNDGENSM